MFVMWFDDSKRPISDKVAAACAAYRARFGADPAIAVLSVVDAEVLAGAKTCVAITSRPYVRQNNFWIGSEEPDV